jgi:hypothetical protein
MIFAVPGDVISIELILITSQDTNSGTVYKPVWFQFLRNNNTIPGQQKRQAQPQRQAERPTSGSTSTSG